MRLGGARVLLVVVGTRATKGSRRRARRL